MLKEFVRKWCWPIASGIIGSIIALILIIIEATQQVGWPMVFIAFILGIAFPFVMDKLDVLLKKRSPKQDK